MKLATLCYVKHANCTLMMHKARGYQQGKWNGLGGKFRPGESPEECLKREVKEESGLTLLRYHLKGVLTFPMFDGDDDWYTFVYTASDFSGELVSSAEGDLDWIPDVDLLNLDLFAGDLVFLPWLEQEHFFSGKLSYQGGRFVGYDVEFYS